MRRSTWFKSRSSTCATLLVVASHLCLAETPTTGPSGQPDWPQTVVVSIGDVETRIEKAKMWTLSGLEFQGTEMATQNSAYGTVVTIRGVGHLGTGHFLDVPGKPGQIETEKVSSLKMFVDGRPVNEFSPQLKLTGNSFRMERESTIRAISLQSTASIENNVLTETAHIRTTASIDLQKAHPMMYAFSPGATVFECGDDDGVLHRGTFQKEGKTAFETEKDARWFAVFDPTTGKGSVFYLLQHPMDAEGWFLLVDAPSVYRKLAAYTFVDKVLPAGYDGTFRSAVGFFAATEDKWGETALRRANELKHYELH